MIEESLHSFNTQFFFEPLVVGALGDLTRFKQFVLCGMGGSRLAGDIVRMLAPQCPFTIHASYGLPEAMASNETLYIASSYSGNTEETLDAAREAFRRKLPLAIITTGGELLQFAKKNSIPFILMPNDGIQPRMAVGYSTVALAALLTDTRLRDELHALCRVDFSSTEAEGKKLALQLKGKVPVISAPNSMRGTAYVWKIKCNETAKIPAFCSVFPELNHNEMTGFDVVETTAPLSKNFCFVFLRDAEGDIRIENRMSRTKELYEQRGLSVFEIPFEGKTLSEKVFRSLLVADWMTLELARLNNVEPEAVPMIEEFKQRLRQQ